MKKYEIKQLPIWSGQINFLWLPDFSEIIDVSSNEAGSNLDILCLCPEGPNVKLFNFWISESQQYSNFITQPPSESYKFFSKVQKGNSAVNLGLAMNGRIEVENYNTTRLYIFIEEVKTMAENRDKQLEKLVQL